MLAWALLDLDAAAGVMVTASHNPPQDNGYKVYLGDGPQIVSPRDVEIAARIAEFDPPSVELAESDDPRIDRLDHTVVDRYVASMRDVRLRGEVPGVLVAYTPMHGVAGETLLRAFEAAALPGAGRRRDAVPAGSGVSDGGVPEPGGAGRDGSRHRAGS